MKINTVLAVVSSGVVLVGCASASVVPLSSSEAQILVDAAPACGATGAQNLAVDMAAIETIRKGYDRFVVTAINGESLPSSVWHSPSVLRAIDDQTIVSTGGYSSIHRRHQNTVRIKMIDEDDPAAANAIDAKLHLGAEWPERVKDGAAVFCRLDR